MKSFSVKLFLLLIIYACFVVPMSLLEHPTGIIFGFVLIGVYVAAIYLKNGVVFGVRVYPYGIEYSKRKNKGLFKKKAIKPGKKHYSKK